MLGRRRGGAWARWTRPTAPTSTASRGSSTSIGAGTTGSGTRAPGDDAPVDHAEPPALPITEDGRRGCRTGCRGAAEPETSLGRLPTTVPAVRVGDADAGAGSARTAAPSAGDDPGGSGRGRPCRDRRDDALSDRIGPASGGGRPGRRRPARMRAKRPTTRQRHRSPWPPSPRGRRSPRSRSRRSGRAWPTGRRRPHADGGRAAAAVGSAERPRVRREDVAAGDRGRRGARRPPRRRAGRTAAPEPAPAPPGHRRRATAPRPRAWTRPRRHGDLPRQAGNVDRAAGRDRHRRGGRRPARLQARHRHRRWSPGLIVVTFAAGEASASSGRPATTRPPCSAWWARSR